MAELDINDSLAATWRSPASRLLYVTTDIVALALLLAFGVVASVVAIKNYYTVLGEELLLLTLIIIGLGFCFIISVLGITEIAYRLTTRQGRKLSFVQVLKMRGGRNTSSVLEHLGPPMSPFLADPGSQPLPVTRMSRVSLIDPDVPDHPVYPARFTPTPSTSHATPDLELGDMGLPTYDTAVRDSHASRLYAAATSYEQAAIAARAAAMTAAVAEASSSPRPSISSMGQSSCSPSGSHQWSPLASASSLRPPIPVRMSSLEQSVASTSASGASTSYAQLTSSGASDYEPSIVSCTSHPKVTEKRSSHPPSARSVPRGPRRPSARLLTNEAEPMLRRERHG